MLVLAFPVRLRHHTDLYDGFEDQGSDWPLMKQAADWRKK
jgi:hypothetical protein